MLSLSKTPTALNEDINKFLKLTTYCSLLWTFHYRAFINKMFKVNEVALRITNEEMLSALKNLLKMEEFRGSQFYYGPISFSFIEVGSDYLPKFYREFAIRSAWNKITYNTP